MSNSAEESCSKNLPQGQAPKRLPVRNISIKRKENRGLKIEERLKQFSEEKRLMQENPKQRDFKELSVRPGSVKEHAEKLNKLTVESDLIRGTFPGSSSAENRRKSSGSDDYGYFLVNTFSPRQRQWALKSSQADYHSLLRLLKEEPKLASFKDFITWFNSIHWAAKHGNADVIKLIAGVHKVSANTRTQGYTALHLAAMAGHRGIMELLTDMYGADPDIRDYSGKKPHQYLKFNRQSSDTCTGSCKKQSPPPSPLPSPVESTPSVQNASRTGFRSNPFFRNSFQQSLRRASKPSLMRSNSQSKHKSNR
ncbi:ankyrin repeat domain-containing protein SOWAHB-like isoform X2 [Limulus polyphemus]|uniref:Ankyrin repeat domain-containing protein SOWAHB-like isoform X2 n=1 Tax=Limulus polyphemus TaxID=6850 RepID=A0ABM1TCU7_LIMPO|nr:ankyrin repeat domain-containing protein SOWAHB-like isoform X2 [Limulus polyphemus]